MMAARHDKWGRREELLFKKRLDGEELSREEVEKLAQVPSATKRRWSEIIYNFGMIPIDWAAAEKKKLKGMPRPYHSAVMDDATIAALKGIVDATPDLYLDQIQTELSEVTGKLVSVATISNTLHHKLGYTPQALGHLAANMDEHARLSFLNRVYYVTDEPRMFILIDETAKDRNASRRRVAWAPRGRGNTYRHEYESWRDTLFTFIAAMDIDGFINEASSCIYRKPSDEDVDNAAGTIDQMRFENYIEFTLVPILGNYALKQPRSIVVLDNAPPHMGPRVRDLIEGAGAILIYASPNSPDLSAIEPCFHVYKADLKRCSKDPEIKSVLMAHLHAVRAVTPKIARQCFRHLKDAIRNVPDDSDEKEKRRREDEEDDAAVSAVLMVILKKRRFI
jgi:hypothetical protein